MMRDLLKKGRILHIVLIITGISCFSSCDYEDPDFTNVRNFRLVKMDGQRLDITLDVTCDNPNKFGFKIKRGDLDVVINDQQIGVVTLSDKIKIKRKSINTYTVPLSVGLANGGLLRLIKLAGQKQVTMQLTGKVRGSVMGFSKSFDVHETMPVDGSLLKLNGI